MKNFDFAITELDGTVVNKKNYKGKEEVYTAKMVAVDALYSSEYDGMGRLVPVSSEEHIKRGALAKRIFDTPELDIDENDITLLKERIAKFNGTRVVCIMFDFLKV